MTYDTMTKAELRTACKAAGVTGYGTMNNDAMRAALAALLPEPAPQPEPQPPTELPPGSYPDVEGFGGTEVDPGRPAHNGITRPRAGGKCAAVWEALDVVMANGVAPTAARVREMAAEHGFDVTTSQVQFYRWRRYNGIKGR